MLFVLYSKQASIIRGIFRIEPEIRLFSEAKNELRSYTLDNKIKQKKIITEELTRDI